MSNLIALVLVIAPWHALAACRDEELFPVKRAPCGRGEVAIFGACYVATPDQLRCVPPFEFRWKGNVCMKPVWDACEESVS